MRCKAWWKKAAGQTGKWSLVLSEEGKEIKGQPSSRSYGNQGSEGGGWKRQFYCLRSTLLLDILKPLTLATYYEKNCFVLNHRLNRHCVCRFLRAKTGNNRNVNNRGNGPSFAVADAA
jgi:hypothetical protein